VWASGRGHERPAPASARRIRAARGTRSWRPTWTTGRPDSPPLNRQRWHSRYAEVRPIRNTPAASSTVKKSGSSFSDNPAGTEIASTPLMPALAPQGRTGRWERSPLRNPAECLFPGRRLSPRWSQRRRYDDQPGGRTRPGSRLCPTGDARRASSVVLAHALEVVRCRLAAISDRSGSFDQAITRLPIGTRPTVTSRRTLSPRRATPSGGCRASRRAFIKVSGSTRPADA
jgi:hypothetical protein